MIPEILYSTILNDMIADIVTFLCLLTSVSVSADDGLQYVEYRKGVSSIIISAPHGGALRPHSIPSRDAGCRKLNKCVWSHECTPKDRIRCKASVLADSQTLELAERLAEELQLLTGQRPHLVINNLHRSKMDANRDISEGAFGVPEAEAAWNKYQLFIKEAESSISGPGLLFDIHGQAHPEDWIELGYLLTSSMLDHATESMCENSSVNHLSKTTNAKCLELLRGRTSLGGFLEQNGYRVVPSPTNPSPNGRRYFSGGYNTRVHGSRDGGVIDAIQIESPRSLRYPNTIPMYARHLALVVYNFTKTHTQVISTAAYDEMGTRAEYSVTSMPVTDIPLTTSCNASVTTKNVCSIHKTPLNSTRCLSHYTNHGSRPCDVTIPVCAILFLELLRYLRC